MNDFDRVFRGRRLSATRTVFSNGPAGIITGLIVLAALAGWIIWQGTGVYRDFLIRQNPFEVHNADLRNATCNTWLVLNMCSADVSYTFLGESHAKSIHIAFVDFSSSGYSTGVVVSRTRPELATLSLGLDMFWSRVIVFAAVAVLILWGALSSLMSGRRALAANAAARAGGTASLAFVEIRNSQRVRGGDVYTYAEAGGTGPAMTTRFGRGEEAYTVADGSGQVMGLALKLDNVATPVMLDDQLTRFDFSETERAAIRAAFSSGGEPELEEG